MSQFHSCYIFDILLNWLSHENYASCIMATYNHIICVILVVMATFSADITACHKWLTKTTIFFLTKNIQSTKTNATSVLLN